jgi:hypothetical protein
MALPDAYRAINLIDFNVAAAASVALLNPLAAQLDLMISLGLGPFQAALSAQLAAAVQASAALSLSFSIGDFSLVAQLQGLISALATLQAALAASLSLGLPPISLSIGAELTATLALAAALKLELSGIQLLIQAALRLTIPAIKLAASLTAALNVGPFYAISFSGTTLDGVSSWLSNELSSAGGLDADGNFLARNQPDVFGVLLIGPDPSFSASFNAIISVPT